MTTSEKSKEGKDVKEVVLPDVGVIVFYTPGANEPLATENAAGLPAMVVSQSETQITIVVFDANGNIHPRHNVSMAEDEGNPPGMGPYCTTALKVIPPPPEPVAPTLNAVSPASAEVGSAEIELELAGEGFTNTSKIYFDGAPVETRYYSETTITTMIKPELATEPETVDVTVKNGDLESAAVQFELIAKPEVEPVKPVTYDSATPEPETPPLSRRQEMGGSGGMAADADIVRPKTKR